MNNLSLDQLLRFGLAGEAFISAVLISWIEPRSILGLPDGKSVAVALAFLGLMTGSLIYGLHRSIPYPLIRRVMFALTGVNESSVDYDLHRWRQCGKDDSLISLLGPWAGQIHFLYCVSWAGLIAWALGSFVGWQSSHLRPAVFWVSISILLGALFTIMHISAMRTESLIVKKN